MDASTNIGVSADTARFHLVALMKAMPELVWLKDLNGTYLNCNRQFERLVGATEQEIEGKTDYDLFEKELADFFRENDIKAASSSTSCTNEEWLKFADNGYVGLFETIKTPVVDALGNRVGILGVARDITKRKQNDANITHINQLYSALSECNRAIVNSTSEEELFQKICQSVVQLGSMKMAWIGLIDAASKTIQSMAAFGKGLEYLDGIHISVEAGNPYSHGPTGTAVLEQRPFWCEDFLNDPLTALWRDRGIASGWASSAALPLYRRGKVIGTLTIYSGDVNAFDEAAKTLLVEMSQDISYALDHFASETERKESELKVQSQMAQLQRTFIQTIGLATTLIEMRDPYTAGHERRAGDLAMAIAIEMGLDAERVEGIKIAGLLHDIGKISIPAEILTKPGRLNSSEYELVKGHAQAGYEALKGVDFPWPVAQIAYQHHERFDGGGYPRGLKGDEILLEARIMAVADTIESMASHRPYRAALGIDKALEEIEHGNGTSYDPTVVTATLRLFREKGYIAPQ